MSILDQGRQPSGFQPKESEFDAQVRARLNGENVFDDSSPRFEDWSPAKQRASYEGIVRTDEKRAVNIQNSEEFVTLHPEFIDHEANGKIFNDTLKAMFGDVAYSIEQFERAYQVCCVNDSLELDKAEIVKQEQAAARERAKAARARRAAETRVFSEGELETMSLEDLRTVENQAIQKRNQQLGEEGGYW